MKFCGDIRKAFALDVECCGSCHSDWEADYGLSAAFDTITMPTGEEEDVMLCCALLTALEETRDALALDA